MNIQFDASIIIAKNYKILKEFYQYTLNQKIKHDFSNCVVFEGGFAIWQLKESYPIAKSLGQTYNENGNTNFSLCFVTDEFDTIVNELANVKINYLHSKAEEIWGQQTIRFYDPERNLIEIGESLKAFSLRLYRSGLSINDVSNKTGLPTKLIKSFVN